MMTTDDHDGRAFHDAVGANYDKKAPDLTKTLNIVVVGKVSSGKSSLINALLRRGRDNPVAAVGARSGVTKDLQVFQLDEHVCIIDSPGLDDISKTNSDVTRRFLESIDVGILVITGSVDASQHDHLVVLRQKCKQVYVVLNKIDEWDRLNPAALAGVIDQWQRALHIEKLYPTCTFGFDPSTRSGIQDDLRGIDELRLAIEDFVDAEGKALLLTRQMGEKRSYALKIIVTALVAVAGEAFIPGSAVYITATQAVAVASLYYVYTGRILAKSSVLAIIPTFASQAIGSTLFLFAKSLLPPTGIIDAAAAGVAMTVTAAMLLTVNSLLSTGAELHEEARLKKRFRELRAQIAITISNTEWKELKTERFWRKLIHDIMYT